MMQDGSRVDEMGLGRKGPFCRQPLDWLASVAVWHADRPQLEVEVEVGGEVGMKSGGGSQASKEDERRVPR